MPNTTPAPIGADALRREELIAMAREADPFGDDGRLVSLAMLTPDTLECFADLVAAREREACAAHYLAIMRKAVAAEREACLRLAERRHLDSPSPVEQEWYQAACKSIAADIRARGAQGEKV